LFNIIDARSLSKFVYLTAPTSFSFNTTGILNSNVIYANYSGGLVTSAYQTSLVFQLKYRTGYEIFTGVWNIFTGITSTNLVSFLSAGTYSTGLMSGSGQFAPNSQVAFQIIYSGLSGNAASLIISGNDILDPINQLINL
jgi:hypothetical protein